MFPTTFATLKAAPSVTGAFGSSPCRIYPFGEAPQGVALPYATQQLVAGSVENYLGSTADMDSYRVQFDVYAATATAARNGASLIRAALESSGYVVSLNLDGRDAETNHYRYSFDMEFLATR
jgi:hypothetical protein